MKIPLLTLIVALLSGCSCAITSISYSPANRRPALEVIDKVAIDSGFRNYHNEFSRHSYRKSLGMHVSQPSGDIEFVNFHCPILPFWVHPGKAFEKRWEDMRTMLKALDAAGFPYRINLQAEQAAAPNRSAATTLNPTSPVRGSEG